MASQKSEVIARFKRIFPECDSTYAASLFDDAHREIVKRCRLREVSIPVDLVAGTRQYDFESENLLVLGANLLKSATVFNPLAETSIGELASGWRADPTQGDPQRYFLVGVDDSGGDPTAKVQIGFDPIPDTSTSAGYPAVRVYCIQEEVLGLTGEVPPQLLSDRVYVAHMAAAYTWERDQDRNGFFASEYEREIKLNVEHVKNRLERLPTRVVGSLGSWQGVV